MPASGSPAQADAVRRCRVVRVKLTRGGKVVRRAGRPVFRRVRRCVRVPSPGCRFVTVKKRTRAGTVVKRRGRPVLIRVERCPAKPVQPSPMTSQPPDLAGLALALPQRVPGNIGLFTAVYANGGQGFYPQGPQMVPAAGPVPTEGEVRELLAAHLSRRFVVIDARVGEALALFDAAHVRVLIPDPTLRAAFAATKGTALEPAIDDLLVGRFSEVRWGPLPNRALIAGSTGGSAMRFVIVNDRYRAERFEYLIGIMGHEFLHHDFGTTGAEEAVLNALSAMTYMQVLVRTPELAYGGTELSRQMNDLALLFVNSREAGSPDSEIVAPSGLGTAPGGPRSTPDLWTAFGGRGSSPAPEPLRSILQNVLVPGTPIPATLDFDQATAERFANLGDTWLTDAQRVQISVLLQLVTVDEIARASGLGAQQVIDALALQPYLAAIR